MLHFGPIHRLVKPHHDVVVFTSGYEVLFESNLGRGAEYRNVSAEESLKRGTVFF